MTPKQSCEKEISRFFNRYYKFCESSDSDDLIDLLSTLSSAFEKLEKATDERFNKNQRLIAIKALRNFSTHESELLNESKALELHSPTMVYFEVKILCLIPLEAISYVLKNLRSKSTKKYVRSNFIFYSKYVDIYPAIFNVAIDLFFAAERNSLDINGEGYSSISHAIEYERNNGYSHYIDGKIVMLDGSDAGLYLESSVISIDQKNREDALQPIDDDGLISATSQLTTSPLKQAEMMQTEDKKYILSRLIENSTIAIERKDGRYDVTKVNRGLTPIEIVLMQQHLDSLNDNED